MEVQQISLAWHNLALQRPLNSFYRSPSYPYYVVKLAFEPSTIVTTAATSGRGPSSCPWWLMVP